jgi:hypothetical protein
MSATDMLKVLGDRGDIVDLRGTFSDPGVAKGFHKYKAAQRLCWWMTT